jgi:hypothetical protein
MRVLILAAGAVLLAGCGGSGDEAAKVETASSLKAGEYKLGWSELKLGLADKGGEEPAAAAFPASTCIAEGGRIEPAAFADKGDECHAVNSYVRNGIVNVQLSCTREGVGKLSQIVSGSFTADAFEAKVETTTEFEDAVDYTMTGKVTGKRVGDCTPAQES